MNLLGIPLLATNLFRHLTKEEADMTECVNLAFFHPTFMNFLKSTRLELWQFLLLLLMKA